MKQMIIIEYCDSLEETILFFETMACENFNMLECYIESQKNGSNALNL